MGQAAFYCRVSTDDQSCERQERDLRAWPLPSALYETALDFARRAQEFSAGLMGLWAIRRALKLAPKGHLIATPGQSTLEHCIAAVGGLLRGA